jgi:hypothetical protein
MMEAMLTTTDNPFNPFEEFDSWRAYDERVGHHTLSYLARIVVVSDELSDADYNAEIERAIDEIVDYNINGLYKKVLQEADLSRR